MNVKGPRILYMGMICTSSYLEKTGETAYLGAASAKMSAVIEALRVVGRPAVLVSLPFISEGAQYRSACVCRGDGFPALFLPTWRSPFVRKLLGIFSMAWFSYRRVRPSDCVVFYNHAVEYIFALLILRMRGISVFQDIEDLPIYKDRGLKSFLNRIGFSVMFRLSSERKIVVSNQIGQSLNLQHYIAVQGIAVDEVFLGRSDKWRQLEAGSPLRVHFGGTLLPSTGLGLFCGAITRLNSTPDWDGRVIEFIVTGSGDLASVFRLASSLNSSFVRLIVYQRQTRSEYRHTLDSCHISLSLRDPSSAISSTTFPSKVIEATSHGIALVSTRVSDVAEIFTDDAVWFLPAFSELELCAVLREAARNPTEVDRRARAGQAVAQLRFSRAEVGRSLSNFLGFAPKFQ